MGGQRRQNGPVPSAGHERGSGTTSLVFAGVGGQGIILTTGIVSRVLLVAGYDVKTSEVHGMAQRGGSVLAMVRCGLKVLSPLVPEGEADWIIASEILEGLRYLDFLRPSGGIILNRYRLDPLPVLRGDRQYPSDAERIMRERAGDITVLDALDMAGKAGNIRAANMVLIGALSRRLHIDEGLWAGTIGDMVPPKAREANLRAFLAGREADGKTA